MQQADDAVLSMFADDVLSPDVIDLALAKLEAMMDAPVEDAETKRARLTASLRKGERGIANLTAAVAGGDAPESLIAALRVRERDVKALSTELRQLDAPTVNVSDPVVRVEALELLEDWRGLLRANVPVARQLLAKLLGGSRVTFYPIQSGAKRWYEVGATPSLEKLLTAVPSLKKALVPVRGFAKGWCLKFEGIAA
jgi:hypothetical protein